MHEEQTLSTSSVASFLTGVGVIASGSAVGEVLITNQQLEQLHGYDPDWILERTGIQQRYVAAAGVTTTDLAFQAARDCVDRSMVNQSNIDLLLVATLSPDHLVPSVANCVQDRLGLNAGAMDIHASCAGFVYAWVTGMQFIASGGCRTVLVVGADASSRFADASDRSLYPLFGDGAGAVLLGKRMTNQGMLSFDLGSDGSGCDLIQVPRDARPHLRMDGPRVFKWAVKTISESITKVAAQAGLELDQIDHFILHQANLRILKGVAKKINIDATKLITNVQQIGNTASASIPLALDQALEQGRIHDGDYVVLSGFGGGLSWASCLLRW